MQILKSDFYSKRYLAFLLILLSMVCIFPYMSFEGTARFEGYSYSSQAAFLATGNVLLPQDSDQALEFQFFEHPLLFKWLQALVFKLFGISEFTSKILVATLSCLTILMIFSFGTYFFSKWTGFFGGIFLLISHRYILHSSFCLLDIPLVFFITLSIFSTLSCSSTSILYIISGLSLACGLLTKGVFGLLPIPVIIFYLILSKKWKHFFSVYFLLGISIAYLSIVFYNYLLSLSHPSITLSSFWKTQGYAPTQDYFFYVRTILQRYFYLLPFVCIVAFKFFRMKNSNQRNIILTLIFWIIVVLAALSKVSSKKQGYYLLPLNPALALLSAIGLDLILKENLKRTIYAFIIVITTTLAFIFSTTPLQLHKTKALKEWGYWKQFSYLQWNIAQIIKTGTPLYYEGHLYVLNFKFSKEFQKKLFLPFTDEVCSTIDKRFQEKIFLITHKHSPRPCIKKLFIIAETQDILLLSNQPLHP